MPQLIPIRLVRSDGQKIQLDATSFTFGVNREVGAMNVLFSQGFRVGTDLNQSRVSIIMDVVFTDDGMSSGASGSGRGASLTVDFDVVKQTQYGWEIKAEGSDLLDYYDGTIICLRTHDRAAGLLTGTNGIFGVKFKHDASKTGASINGTPVDVWNPFIRKTIKAIEVTHDLTQHVNVAAAFYAAFTSSAPTLGVGLVDGGTNEKPSAAFTATLTTGFMSGSTNEGVLLVSVQHGSALNGQNIVSFKSAGNTHMGVGGPWAGRMGFQGGKKEIVGALSESLSAGEKAQNILGIVSNSNSTDTPVIDTEGLIAADINPVAGGYGAPMPEDAKKYIIGNYNEDYIVGLQIPYESLITSNANQGRVVRNFFTTNGLVHSSRKGSEANTKMATDGFDTTAEGHLKGGIEGVVDRFDFTYNAGENVYEGKLSFLPVDKIF
tara:strand:- start:238 stop:1542 length:1305 start_codon:yes stop_codon:yes gene_type:complete